MNKDQVKGSTKEVIGKVKEATGKAVGNESLRGKGQAEQVAGNVQRAYGDAKENLKKALDD